MARISRRALVVAAVCAAVVSLVAGHAPARGADVPKKAPDPKAGGAVCEWTSAGGVVCFWRAPQKYDAAKGANLTLILHGSNLSHGWGFANHDAKTFRPDDMVVCPDGTTPAGKGAFNFLEGDTRKAHALLEELKKTMKVRQVFLYGHSQGSFFSLAWAGDFPDDVDGLVAHASGLWASSQTGPKGHRQAIVLMHGTQDPVVPYTQSVGGFDALREANYPTVRLRSLEGWNHWPAELNGPVPHTSQQLAWVEGMTTTDADRLNVSFDLLSDVNGETAAEHDFAGLWSLAGRVATMESAPADLKARAAKAKQQVETLAAAHVAALALPDKLTFDKKPWIGHLPVFLRAFQGVPAREELAKKLEDVLATHKKDAVAHLRKYYGALKQDKKDDAFAEGVAAIQSGWLWCECWDQEVRKNLREWRKDAKKLKLSKESLKAYDAVFEDFEKALTEGWKSFEATQKKFGN